MVRIKKIAVFLETAAESGGVYQYCMDLLDAMTIFDRKEYEIIVFYTNRKWKPILKSYPYKNENISLTPLDRKLQEITLYAPNHTLCLKILKGMNTYAHTVGKKIRQYHVDLCVFPSNRFFSVMFSVPSVGFIHDLMHRYEKRFPEVGEKKEYQSRESTYKKMCMGSKAVIVDSMVGKKQLIESYGINNEKVHVLPYISNMQKLIKKSSLNMDGLNQYNLPDKFIFYPAQFWLHKNHLNLLKAVSILKNKEVHLVLTGSAKNGYKSVKDAVKQLNLQDRVHFLGYIKEEDKVALYKKALALVMPTFFGPTNIPPLEAFELGCPVLVSDIYGMPQQVGDAALLFDPNKPEEIAEAIDRISRDEDLRKELIAKGYKRHEKWNIKHFGEKYQKIVETILNVN